MPASFFIAISPRRIACLILLGLLGSSGATGTHTLGGTGVECSCVGDERRGYGFVSPLKMIPSGTSNSCHPLQLSSECWNRKWIGNRNSRTTRRLHRARAGRTLEARVHDPAQSRRRLFAGGGEGRGDDGPRRFGALPPRPVGRRVSSRGATWNLGASNGGSVSGGVSTRMEAGAESAPQAQNSAPKHMRKRFGGLAADRFQHPFDQEATAILRRLPGLELAIRSVVPALEDAVYIDNISNSILVGPQQMASLHSLLVEACSILDMPVPDLYIRQNPVPNAYTLAIRGKKPFIVLHTSLVDLMEPEEVQAVIAHELGHLKCEHGIWVTLATVLTSGLYRGGGLGAFLADTLGLRRGIMRWSRAAEFTCDRAAMLVAQDVNVVVSVLLKLAGGSVSQASELSVAEFLKQASAYDLASNTRIGRLLRRSQSQELTHPLPVIRARELVKFSESPQYQSIFRRGVPLR